MQNFRSTRFSGPFLLAAVSAFALAQSTAPTDNKGTSTKVLGSIECRPNRREPMGPRGEGPVAQF